MEGVVLVLLPALQVHGIPPDQILLFLVPPGRSGFHRQKPRQLQNPVTVNVLGIDVVVSQCLDTGSGIAGKGDIGKNIVLHRENIGHNGAVVYRTGNIHRRLSALEIAECDSLDVFRFSGKNRFP